VLLAGGTRKRGSPAAIVITAPFPGALLTGLVAALGPACRLRRRYAHAPAGAISLGAMRPWRTPDQACGLRQEAESKSAGWFSVTGYNLRERLAVPVAETRDVKP